MNAPSPANAKQLKDAADEMRSMDRSSAHQIARLAREISTDELRSVDPLLETLKNLNQHGANLQHGNGDRPMVAANKPHQTPTRTIS